MDVDPSTTSRPVSVSPRRGRCRSTETSVIKFYPYFRCILYIFTT
jgi:hypothetical protein